MIIAVEVNASFFKKYLPSIVASPIFKDQRSSIVTSGTIEDLACLFWWW